MLDHLAKHIKHDFLIFFRSLSVKDAVPGKIKVLNAAMFAQNFQQWSDLTWRDLIPADIKIYDRFLRCHYIG
jgi:hypothetical protein